MQQNEIEIIQPEWNLDLISQHVAFTTRYMELCVNTQDWGMMRLYDEANHRLVAPSDIHRRSNDFIAAAYVHAVALAQSTGFDSVDPQGHCMELKLAYIKSDSLLISERGAVLNQSLNSFHQTVNAHFRVYSATKKTHHTKNTAFILMDMDHNCYITGFIMRGSDVQRLLHGDHRNSISRHISLGQFMKYGYEIGSSVPHIGWTKYYSLLTRYLLARGGKLPLEERDIAVNNWVNLRENLVTL